jgi:arsenate reductase (thioredoxin)
MSKANVLFVCIHNSARSQMAEAFLNKMGSDFFLAESAGIEPGNLNPLVVKVMQEIGIDISANRTKDISEFLNQRRLFQYVITVCDEASAERCPVFPGPGKRLHRSFSDPSSFQGTEEEKLAMTRVVRDQIKSEIELFIQVYKNAIL